MASVGPLERTRAAHEEIERYQAAVVAVMKEPPRTHRETVYQGHVVRGFVERICTTAQRAATLYDDKDGARREELSSITGSGMTMFQLFYNKLKEVKEYHRKEGELIPEQLGPSDAEYEPRVEFTGPEHHGRCLDLASLHLQYQNLGAGFERVDYVSYLDSFSHFDHKEHSTATSAGAVARNKAYVQYLRDLREYLVAFYRRAQPLFDVDSKLATLSQEFQAEFDAGKFAAESAESDEPPQGEEQQQQEFWCAVCSKGFAKQTVFDAHMRSKKHMQKKATGGSANAAARREALELEFVIEGLCEPIANIVRNTKDDVNRKLGRTANQVVEEAEADSEEDNEIDADEARNLSAPDDELPKQTIDNYPVGWDGRPIPYWLYKLHGLGVEFKCEICGDMSYWGRRAFEKHFQEFRHTHAMAALGIPNSVHFFDVTKIADAVTLWQKMQADRAAKEWRPEDEEEREDADGNVYSKKLYEALIKQGVITQ